MSIVIVATPGSGTANSFATETQFIAYAATRLNVPAGTTVSGSACTETEKKALIEATRELTVMNWSGDRVDTTQALSWPRQYAYNPDLPYSARAVSLTLTTSEAFYDTDVIPQRVIDATCELALQFVKAGTTDIASADDSLGLTALSVGSISLDFAQPFERAQGLSRYPRVLALITPLLDASITGGLTVVRC